MSLQETSERHTLNGEYENLVTAYIKAALECILTKPKANWRVPWESIVVREKWGCRKIASLVNKRNPTNANEEVLSWCNGESAGLWNRCKRVQTPVTLLHSLLDKYSWERYEPLYPPIYGLNSTTTVLLGGWVWH